MDAEEFKLTGNSGRRDQSGGRTPPGDSDDDAGPPKIRGEKPPPTLADDQTLAEADQSAADVDQTSSDADQESSDTDWAASVSDQIGANSDQRASDRDQATADREHAANDSDPVEQIAYDTSAADRSESSLRRLSTAAGRASAESARQQQSPQREDSANLRDLTAMSRDQVAEARDSAAAAQEDSLRLLESAEDHPFETLLDFSSEVRARAAADRARAAGDRARAAQDRAHAAEDRAQARIDLQTAQLDSLTGIYMRDLGLLTLQHEIDRARRGNDPFVLAYVDVDGLKQLNDAEGHAAGDAVLQSVVTALNSTLRSYDPVVRVGGDEFLCGLTKTTLEASEARIVQMQEAVKAGSHPSSISVGIAALTDDSSLKDLIAKADLDMYERRQRARRQA